VLVFTAGLSAAELHISYPVLQRMLAEQAFTQDGRRYVRGTPATRCNFAYLENPRISGENGRLIIQARFTGRTAWDVMGRCVGMGDAFDVRISGRPDYQRAGLSLKEVGVEISRDTFYSRRVKDALRRSMERDFHYDVTSQARKMLESQGAYKTEIRSFEVPRVWLDNESVVLEIQFILMVK